MLTGEMTPAGDDRLETDAQGRLILTSRHSKGWIGRRTRSATASEFPGTCIEWQDSLFEVVRVQTLAHGTRYMLVPWTESHTIRQVEQYNNDTENRRAAERREQRKRSKSGWQAYLAAPITGLLPATVQQRLEDELGVPAATMTLFSAFPLLLFGALCVLLLNVAAFAGAAAAEFPPWVLFFGAYFFPESLVRIVQAFGAKPMGSAIAVIPYVIFMRPKRGRGEVVAVKEWRNEEQVALGDRSDLYHVAEPFLGLLSAEEQKRLQEQYGFDWMLWGKRTANTVGIFAAVGAIATVMAIIEETLTSPRLASLLVSLALLAEQLARLKRLGRGEPASSVLGVLVRPLFRRLLTPPPQSRIRDARPDEMND